MRSLAPIAALCTLAGCSVREDWDIVAVKSRPAEGYDTLEDTYGCTASVIHRIPATRYFKNGSQEDYTIVGVIGYKDICK